MRTATDIYFSKAYCKEEIEEELKKCAALGGDIDTLEREEFSLSQLMEIRKGLEAGLDVSIYQDRELNWYLMQEIRLGLLSKINMMFYVKQGLDWMQLSEIRLGIEHGIDVTQYASEKYIASQMQEIRLGLEHGVAAVLYSDPEYDWFQMEEIRLGLEKGLDISVYAKMEYDYLKMREIRKGIEGGIDLIPYVEKDYSSRILAQIHKLLFLKVNPDPYLELGYNDEQLEQIGNAIEQKVNLLPYLSKEMFGVQLDEIIKGLVNHLDVSIYAKPIYNWRQMHEIRRGLENRIDPTIYARIEFSFSQMREIRLGLQAGIDVTTYAKVVYATQDMRREREKLEKDKIHKDYISQDAGIENLIVITGYDYLEVSIESNGMEASMLLDQPIEGMVYTVDHVIEALKKQGVVLGIDREAIENILNTQEYGISKVIARGREPVDGEDGEYEFLFRTELPIQPKQLPDGSVDYRHMEYFEEIKAGDKVAVYKASTLGKGGFSVTGRIFPAKRGKEKPILKGTGFVLLEDKCTYVAALSGKIELFGYKLVISKLLVIPGDVTYAIGDFSFEGDIKIKGSVGSGVIIEAAGNIEIDGNVESAKIISGKDILLKSGVAAGGNGLIQAKGSVYGKFFEAVTIKADKDIQANYMLNCDVNTMGHVLIHGSKGMIIGGRVKAVLGIKTRQLGNIAQVFTAVEIGITDELIQQQAQLIKEMDKVASEIEIFQFGIEKFSDKYDIITLADMPVYQKILMAINFKQDEMEKLKNKEKEIKEHLAKAEQGSITVFGPAYPRSQVIIDRIPYMLMEELANIVFKRKADKVAIYRNNKTSDIIG